jgi:hypothetical protein
MQGISSLSQMLGLRVDTTTGGGSDLLQQVKNQTQKKKNPNSYLSDQPDFSQFSALSQWLARNTDY